MRVAAVFTLLLSLGGAVNAQPTYSREVSRIMQAKCQRCHRPNDVAPFALMNYSDARTWADDIKRVIEERQMPPWKPVPGQGEFRDNFGLTEDERTTIRLWANAGAPEGDPAELPQPLPDTGEWHLGQPDRILQMAEPYVVPRRKDTYRCFVIPTGLAEDRFVSAVQVLPGNRQVVHHVILFLDSTGQAEKLDAKDPEPGYECFGGPGIDLGDGGLTAAIDLLSGLGGWVPGSRTQHLPTGVGLFLPQRAKIVMQVHYYPAGRPGPDQTKVGLYYSKAPVERRLRYLPVLNTTFRIPPGDADHEVKATLPIPPLLDAHLIQIVPHMHLLGRKIAVQAERNGRQTSLIGIDDWDFNWQGFYTYVEPVALPAGTMVRLTCRFDNSSENPRNPHNPLTTVRWGEGTEDEMCLAFIGITFDRENLLPFAPRGPSSVPRR
jgi:hypothetical protein